MIVFDDGRRLYEQPYQKRLYAKLRRARLRALGVCINAAKHGAATHGVLCAACRITHRGSC